MSSGKKKPNLRRRLGLTSLKAFVRRRVRRRSRSRPNRIALVAEIAQDASSVEVLGEKSNQSLPRRRDRPGIRLRGTGAVRGARRNRPLRHQCACRGGKRRRRQLLLAAEGPWRRAKRMSDSFTHRTGQASRRRPEVVAET